MQLRVEKIVYPGRSLCRNNGKAVFTDEGLPGEEVELDIRQDKKHFSLATTCRVITASPDRLSPHCGHYRTCGLYQYIAYPVQLAIKHQQLGEMLRNIMPNAMAIPALEPAPQAWGYRNKLQAQILPQKDGACSTAYHQPQTRDGFVSFDSCFLASDRLNQALANVRALISRSRALHVREVVLRESRLQGEILVLLRGASAVKNNALTQGLEELRQTAGVASALFQTIPGRRIIPLLGKNLLREKIAGRDFRFGAASFLQVNIGMLEALLAYLHNSLSITANQRILDLYAGIGTFGLCLGDSAAALIFVESEPENVAFLKQNISALQPRKSRIIAGRAETVMQRLSMRPNDIIIVDPPRVGLEPRLCQQLCRKPVGALVYISCDPMTLSRDLKILNPAYQLTHIKAFDFFPQTPHIETCCILRPR